MSSKKAANTKKKPEYKSQVEPLPMGNSPKHLYAVKLLVLDDANLAPDDVLNHVMAACLQHPKITAIVNGYGASSDNLTLSDARNRASSGRRIMCVGITNLKIPKKATEVPMISLK